jgi:hypothetical protein
MSNESKPRGLTTSADNKQQLCSFPFSLLIVALGG